MDATSLNQWRPPRAHEHERPASTWLTTLTTVVIAMLPLSTTRAETPLRLSPATVRVTPTTEPEWFNGLAVAASPSGDRVAMGRGAEVWMWRTDAVPDDPGLTFAPLPGPGVQVEFSPDGSRLAVLTGRQLVNSWYTGDRDGREATPAPFGDFVVRGRGVALFVYDVERLFTVFEWGPVALFGWSDGDHVVAGSGPAALRLDVTADAVADPLAAGEIVAGLPSSRTTGGFFSAYLPERGAAVRVLGSTLVLHGPAGVPPVELAPLSDGLAWLELARSRDGLHVAGLVRRGSGDTPAGFGVALADLTTAGPGAIAWVNESTPLAPGRPLRALAVSDDGSRVAVSYGPGGGVRTLAARESRAAARVDDAAGGSDSGVFVMDGATGRVVAALHAPLANGLTFGPGGDALHVGTRNGRLLTFDLSALDARPTTIPTTLPAPRGFDDAGR